MKTLLAKMSVLDWIILVAGILFVILMFVFHKWGSAWSACLATGCAVWLVRSLIGEPKL